MRWSARFRTPARFAYNRGGHATATSWWNGRETWQSAVSPDFSPVFGCLDVAQALLPAASALVPTLAFDTVSRPRTGVETSLDTAGTSACATWPAQCEKCGLAGVRASLGCTRQSLMPQGQG